MTEAIAIVVLESRTLFLWVDFSLVIDYGKRAFIFNII